MGRDKALLPWGDSTFLGSLVRTLRKRCDPVIVVLGHNAEQIRPAAEGAQVVVNEGYDRGMLSSLQTGLRAAGWDVDGVVFTLVDHPGLRPETLDKLVDAFESSGANLVLPLYYGERGHPAVISRAVLGQLLALPTDASAKRVLRAHYAAARFVNVDDPAVVADIDTPADLP
ncbi:MAG: nucleotidyltransferase family protein [Bryobacterales bacterium]|nr:nucleotidyltransferase family protein [Bryobacterales bacterium]